MLPVPGKSFFDVRAINLSDLFGHALKVVCWLTIPNHNLGPLKRQLASFEKNFFTIKDTRLTNDCGIEMA